MIRKIAQALVISALGITLVPGTAAADDEGDTNCTATGTVNTPKFGFNPPTFVGTRHATYIGTVNHFANTWRVWHVTFTPKGAMFSRYEGAFAAVCNADDIEVSTIDLTRDEDQTLSAFDQRCGTADFVNGAWNYHHLGGRAGGLDYFHYWRTTYFGPNYAVLGVTAARCP